MIKAVFSPRGSPLEEMPLFLLYSVCPSSQRHEWLGFYQRQPPGCAMTVVCCGSFATCMLLQSSRGALDLHVVFWKGHFFHLTVQSLVGLLNEDSKITKIWCYHLCCYTADAAVLLCIFFLTKRYEIKINMVGHTAGDSIIFACSLACFPLPRHWSTAKADEHQCLLS